MQSSFLATLQETFEQRATLGGFTVITFRHDGKGTTGRLAVGVGFHTRLPFTLKGGDNFSIIVINFHIGQLQLVIDHGRTKAVHFNQFTTALVDIFVRASAVSPMPPGEDYLGRTRKDFQHFPGKGGKGVVRGIMRGFPSGVFTVPSRTGIQQDIVVADLIGFLVVEGLVAIGTNFL